MANKETKEPGKEHFEMAFDWETSRIEQIEKSERIAWNVAKGASLVAVLAITAVVLLVPLKESIPYVVRIDKNTGYTDIVTTLHAKTVTVDEAADKYWVSKFVRARESWEWYTAQEDYDTVRLLASPDVGRQYAKLFEGPTALDKEYGQGTVVTVDINSVVPHGSGQASVRFIKKINRRDAGDVGARFANYIATIGYEYKFAAKMKEKDRLKNPLGFQVMSYRVDSEVTQQTEAVSRPPEPARAPAITVPALETK